MTELFRKLKKPWTSIRSKRYDHLRTYITHGSFTTLANYEPGNRPSYQAHGMYTWILLLENIFSDRRQFDERKGATWHCIVGRNFGSFVTHGTLSVCSTTDEAHADRDAETKHFIYFYLGNSAILLFKTQ